MLVKIKYDVVVYVAIGVKRMLRKCQEHGNLRSNL